MKNKDRKVGGKSSAIAISTQVLLIAILFIGGVGWKVYFVIILGLAIGIVVLLYLLLRKRNIELPPNFTVLSFFLILLALSLSWSLVFGESLKYLLLFLGGWVFWLVSYNLTKDYSGWLEKVLIILGIGFGILFVARDTYNWPIISGLSLFLTPSAIGKYHYHIGDFWAVVSIVVAYKLAINPKRVFYWLLIPPAVYFLSASMSRTALVALAAGLIFMEIKGIFKRYRLAKVLVLGLLFVLFTYISASKSLLLSKPYFIQALAGLRLYPWGTGLGNFGAISHDARTHLFGLSGFSLYVHNVLLEVISGAGLLGLIFTYWFIKVLYGFLSRKNKGDIISQAVFVVISANFLFDYTYFIPTMFWLWFLSLGLAQ